MIELKQPFAIFVLQWIDEVINHYFADGDFSSVISLDVELYFIIKSGVDLELDSRE
jgi:hypothetical protein